jgi:tyrosine decarboxylase/aspartate 1-decarboxylase
MQEKGLNKKEIVKILDEKLKPDLSYDSGYILGSMCTDALNFGKEIYMNYVCKNLGDPGLFPGTAQLEKELVHDIGDLFGEKNISGTFTTGGSEANIIAMRIARDIHPEIKKPEMIVPKSAHYSFDKGAAMLGITLRKARLNRNFEVDLNHYKSLINENTVGVVGVAGTTSLGLVDPIGEIGKLIKEKEIFFHIDAAFGGFVLPFLKKLGYKVPPWDFNLSSVDSITADPHKMGLGIIPSGGLFLREPKILQETGFEIPYLAGGNFKHLNIVGTRSGGTVIAFWAIVKYLGVEGFLKIVNDCMETTRFLAKKIEGIKGIKLAAEPFMNVVGITTETGESICELEESLRSRKWMLGKFLDFNLVRIVVMPHVKKSYLSRFISDLKAVVKELGL